ncbi:hypothetical protein B0H16DRAFT_239650 [Mycena metata]|uniref:Uncharacterized protein n=1 Tax=Mycena metata TaxID=1033252 RepID=A0AAD7HUL8_9AGAR|nr:hypothetical protein B0H16DRAFT_239650 [Mycena metata]
MHNSGSGVLAGVGRALAERYHCYWVPSRPCGAEGLPLWLPRRISRASRVLPLYPTPPPPYSSTPLPRTTGRHDDPEEKRQNAIRVEISAGQRFDGFAAESSEDFAKWRIEEPGLHVVFSEMIDNAREVIFIQVSFFVFLSVLGI